MLLMSLAAAAGADPFRTRELIVPGRVVQIWGAQFGAPCPSGGRNVFVLSVIGTAPREQRRATAFPCAETWADTGLVAPLWSVTVPNHVIGVDTAETSAEWPGEEMLWVSASGLQLRSGDGTDAARVVPGSAGLPLPDRTRSISRLRVAGDWNNEGSTSVLLPTSNGVRWIRLADGAQRELALPIEADYRTASNAPPAGSPELARVTLNWPALRRADDDGDGTLDLFALWRFGAWVFRISGEGLPAHGPDGIRVEPTHRTEFQPFDDEQEIRHESSSVEFFVNDMNRDGLADLVVDRTIGSMLNSSASTDVYLNDGSGVRLDDSPAASLETDGAIQGIEVVDLDGDGSSELFQTLLNFNAVQMLRFVVTGHTRVEFAVLALDSESETGFRESWSDDVSLEINWETGRITGLFPDLRGDWNSDGRPDLIYPSGENEIAFRIGTPTDDGPGFSGQVATQRFPLAAGTIWPEDLDGDGLTDMVAFDERDPAGEVFVLINRGEIEGTAVEPASRDTDARSKNPQPSAASR